MQRKTFVYTLAVLLPAGILLNGCSKDEDDLPGGKNAKITLSVSEEFSKASGDDFSLSVGAARFTSNSETEFIDWTVDGEVKKGTITTVTSDYVDGGRENIVVESVQEFASNTGSVTISSFNIGGEPFTITYKVEVDGKVKDEQTVTLADGQDPLYKNYAF